MKQKYYDLSNKFNTKRQVVDEKVEELYQIIRIIGDYSSQISNSINEIDSSALRRFDFSTEIEYLELSVTGELKEKKVGYMDRVKKLYDRIEEAKVKQSLLTYRKSSE